MAVRPSLEEFRERLAAHRRVELPDGVVVDALEDARQELQAVGARHRPGRAPGHHAEVIDV